ncbi:MAG TPA: alpha/beta hydrolase [Candidatus Obscuribacterales bacterium]
MVRRLLSPVAALGALYVALSPRVFVSLYGSMLFKPDRFPAGNYECDSLNGLTRKEVFFPAPDGRQLHGWLFRREDTRWVILFNHGNAGNLTYRLGLVKLLIEAGGSVFLYDYRGYGLSEGSPSLKSVCEDGLAAYDYLVTEQQFAPEDVVIYGESLGCGVACHTSRYRGSAGLILQSAFTSLSRIGKHVLPLLRIYPEWLFPRPELNNLVALQGRHPPLLIFHGKLDTLVPFSHAEELYAQASEPKTLVPLPTTGHNDISGTEPELFKASLSKFLRSLPEVPGASPLVVSERFGN